ncbi:Hypothetical predicted protein [Podarcis lilfordi]|uniref:Uncharacterized protein n=1 Tax=Podarcis lilfordi TaxID=74358 RepID=A0AA35KXG5_9SAUR|nr:Hypothetical predicted protein [Podarcis lilfordi]
MGEGGKPQISVEIDVNDQGDSVITSQRTYEENKTKVQGHDSRDQAPAPVPRMKNQRASQRFPAATPHASSPLPLIHAGNLCTREHFKQKRNSIIRGIPVLPFWIVLSF